MFVLTYFCCFTKTSEEPKVLQERDIMKWELHGIQLPLEARSMATLLKADQEAFRDSTHSHNKMILEKLLQYL